MLNRTAVVAATLVLAACTSTGTPRPAPDPPTPDLARFYAQHVVWGSCEQFPGATQRMDCGRIDVPMDYAHPEKASISIPLSRLPARGEKIGSLFFNPGGPGASGLGMPSMGARSPLLDRFDLVGFDPRGIGASIPAIQCLTNPERDADRADLDVDYSPGGIAQTEDEEKRYAQRCEQVSGRDLLANVGTRDVAKDLDIMRTAVGDAKLNYLGYSYGTAIGTQYAETFGGSKIRAMVLDGAVDPTVSRADKVVRQLEGFQKAFDAFVANCVTIDGCPLGTDPAKANERYRALTEPLITNPAQTDDPRGLSFNDARTGTAAALYQEARWPKLFVGLLELEVGRGDQLLALADEYERRNEDGSYDNEGDAFNAVRCVDYPAVTDRAVVGRDDRRFRDAAPFLDDHRGTGQAPLDQCAFWPVPPTGDPHQVRVSGLPPIVVISTTGDPATPYESGEVLAKQLGGVLVTYRGTQHTVALGGVECIDETVFAYFIDSVVPPVGKTC
ncbi:MAG: alpha/beta hydrolase [Nocardiaceae bacterium]|nr:alpha/beta hydrolase [Nocardiaceae bacterium]